MALVAARATRSAASSAAASASAAASSVLRASHELLLPQPSQQVGESSHSADSTAVPSATPSSSPSEALNIGQRTLEAAQVAEAAKTAAAAPAEPPAAGRNAAVSAATMQQALPSCQSSLLLGSFLYAGAEPQQHGLFPCSFLRQSDGRRLQLRLTPSSSAAAGLRPLTSMAAAAAAAASAPTIAAAAAGAAQSAAAAATAGDGSDAAAAAAAARGGWGGGGGASRPPTTVATYRKSALWGRWYAASQEDYVATVYRTVKQNKAYLLRDVYEHMLMDGLVPTRDMFHVMIGECKRKKRLQDIFFFFNEMKARGMMLDVVLYNCVITACGLSGHLEKAFQVAAEMEANGFAPQERTFIALVTACGLAGRVPEAEGVLQRMAAAGYPMTKFTYSALITAHGKRRPHTAHSHQKIFELLEQAIASENEREKIEGAAAAEEKRRKREEEEEMMEEAESAAAAASEEDGEDGDGGGEGMRDGARSGGEQDERDPRQVVHRAAIRAMLEFKDLKGALRVVEIVRRCGMEPDLHSKALLVRGHLYAREWTKAMEILDDFRRSGGVPSIDLYVRMMKGGVAQNSEEGMAAATKLFEEFTQTRGFFLNTASGRSLMDLATSDYCGNVDFARLIFAHIHANSLRPRLIPVEPQAVLRFVSFLTKRGVAEDDPQLVQARDILTHSPPARTRQLWREHLRQQAAQQDRLLQQQG